MKQEEITISYNLLSLEEGESQQPGHLFFSNCKPKPPNKCIHHS